MSRYIRRLRLDVRVAYPGTLGVPAEDQYPLRDPPPPPPPSGGE